MLHQAIPTFGFHSTLAPYADEEFLVSKPQEGKHFQSCIDLLLQLLNGYAIIWLCNQKINQTTREAFKRDRKSTRLNSSHVEISYAVFCLKKKKKKKKKKKIKEKKKKKKKK